MSSDPTEWSDALQNWFDESDDFVYGSGPKSSSVVVGHYTQVKGIMKIFLPQMLSYRKLLQIMTHSSV